MQGGLSRAEAEREVQRRFGNVDVLKRETTAIDARSARRATGVGVLAGIVADIRQAARGMRLRPGLSTTIVLTLALAIGASTAIFSVVDGVLLRPLPVPWLGQLHVVSQDLRTLGLEKTQLGPPSVEDLIARDDIFASGSAYTGAAFTLESEGAPRRVEGARTMGEFFQVLGGRAMLGTTYRADDSEPGNQMVVVLGHALWRDITGGDPQVVGKTIELSGMAYEVLGVMPPDFRFPGSAELWIPQVLDESLRSPNARGRLFMTPVMRTHEGVSEAQLAAALDDQSRRWAEEFEMGDLGLVLRSEPLTDSMAGMLRPVLIVLVGAVGFVLLIACANIASLQLVRAIGRAKELAVRSALGAGRGVIARQLLIESLLLALVGGVLGVAIAVLLLKLLSLWAVGQYAMLADVAINGRVLAIAAATTTGSGVLFGVAPSWRAARTNLNEVLKESVRGSSGGPSRSRVLQGAVMVQVAFTLMLLLGATVLTRSLGELIAADPGFRPERVYSMGISVAGTSFNSTPEGLVQFYDGLLERLRGMEGVEEAAVVRGLPFTGTADSSPFTLEDVPQRSGEPERHANIVVASDGYFRTMGIPLLSGRDFEGADRTETQPVAIIDEQIARNFFGEEDPVGRTISQLGERTIIGVVGSVRHANLHQPEKQTIYYTSRQVLGYTTSMQIVVRSSLPMSTVVSGAQSAASALDPSIPVYEAREVSELVSRSLVAERLATATMIGFALLSLLLAALGVYGVINYVVSQRVPEIGIRLALGAAPSAVVRMVLLNGTTLVVVGVGVGLLSFLALAGYLEAILYRIAPRDPVTIVAGALAVLVVGSVACLVPARKAARVQPTDAMRA